MNIDKSLHTTDVLIHALILYQERQQHAAVTSVLVFIFYRKSRERECTEVTSDLVLVFLLIRTWICSTSNLSVLCIRREMTHITKAVY